MIKLRDYQIECISVIESHFEQSNSQLIQMPTGAGKTIVFLQYLVRNSRKSVIVCPSKDLVLQTFEKSKLFFEDGKVHAKTGPYVNMADHYICTAASLWRGKTLDFLLTQNIDTLILDECHHSCSTEYQKFIQKLLKQNPRLKILGFTATPERLDKGDLLVTFGKVTFRQNILDLIEKKHLCDISAYKIKTGQNFSDKVISGDDFSQVALRDLDNESRNNLIIKTYRDNCKGKKTLIFCINIDHAEKLADEMQKKGIKCAAVHGKLPTGQRNYSIEQFRKGKIDVLTNCQLLTEGFDEPSIEALIVARPTKSKALYCQMIGRGLRNSPGKDLCYLYELADNSHKICTFDTMVVSEKKFSGEYTPGIRLSALKNDVEKISMEIEHLHKEHLQLFDKKYDFSNLKTVESALLYHKEKFVGSHFSPTHLVQALYPIIFGIYIFEIKKEYLPEYIDRFQDIFLYERSYTKKGKLRSDGGKRYMMDKLHAVALMLDEMIEKGLSMYNVYKDIFFHYKEKYCDPENISSPFWYLVNRNRKKLSILEVSELTKCSVKLCEKFIKKGTWSFFQQIGDQYFCYKDDLDKWIEENTVTRRAQILRINKRHSSSEVEQRTVNA